VTTTRGPTGMILVAVPVLLVLAVLVVPQLDRPFWHDEVATLELFAASGPWYPFQDYSIPNNHLLSSVVLSLMQPLSDAPAWLRLWPLTTSVLAAVLLVALAGRLGGYGLAWLAGMAFATSGVVLAFALQLRGYAPSWACLVLAALAVLSFVQGRWSRRSAMAVFAIASVLAVGLLPTNLTWLLLLAAAAAWLRPAPAGTYRRDGLAARLSWLLLPWLGLICYAGAAGQFLVATRQSWNPASRWQTIAETYADLLQDIVWLLPLAALGILSATIGRGRGAAASNGHVLAVVTVLLAPLLVLLAMPSPAFSRIIVPAWPLLLLAVAWLALRGLHRLPVRLHGWLLVALAACMTIAAHAREQHDWRPWPPWDAGNAIPQTLLRHYYREGYRPDLAAAAMADWLQDPQALVWSDHSDFPSLRWHLRALAPALEARLHFVPAIGTGVLGEWLHSRPVLLVTATRPQACAMLQRAGETCAEGLETVATTGFFKAYTLRHD
jgi:hypothetical protein